MLPSFRHICLFSLILAQCIAVPTTEPAHDRQPVLPIHDNNDLISPYLSSPFAKFCSSLLGRIRWPSYARLAEPSSPPSGPESAAWRHVQARYGDDAVLRFTIRSEDEATSFAEAVDTLFLDLWDVSNNWVDVRVARKVLPAFLDLLPSSLQQSFTPIIPSISNTIYETFPQSSAADFRTPRLSPHMPHDLFFENYQPLGVIYPWLREMASMFPDRTQLFKVGTSYEGRDIAALSVGIPSSSHLHEHSKPRDTILITAGTHAREWISTSSAAYILRSLIHNFTPSKSGTIGKLLTNYDFVFIPVLNPDGYQYTWTTDRLWRKNRQSTSLPFCPGIDLDRSFPFAWDGSNITDNPCTESYPGDHPLQAVEAQRLVTWAKNETLEGRRNFVAYLDLHSYSQQILYPYSYSCNATPHNLEDLEEIAFGLSKAFRLTSGHTYSVDSACEGSALITNSSSTAGGTSSTKTKNVRTKLEENGGSALDFFYQEMQVKYAFQIKLRDTGTHGFLLPRESIVPTGLEAFEAVIGLGKWLLGNRGIEGYDTKEAFGVDDDLSAQPVVQVDMLEEEEEDEGRWWRRRKR